MDENEKIQQLNEDYERLKEKAERLLSQARQKKSQASELARKARTRRLIEHGGLIEKLLGEHYDKGLLVGIINEYKDAFQPGEVEEYLDLKRNGDRLIAEWEEERKAKKNKKTAESEAAAHAE